MQVDRQAILECAIKNNRYNPFEHAFAAFNVAVELGIADVEKARDFANCVLEGIQYDVLHNSACVPANVPRIAKMGRRFATSSSGIENVEPSAKLSDLTMSVVPSSDSLSLSLSQDSNDYENLADFETEQKRAKKRFSSSAPTDTSAILHQRTSTSRARHHDLDTVFFTLH